MLPKAEQPVVASEGRNVRGDRRQIISVVCGISERQVSAFVLV